MAPGTSRRADRRCGRSRVWSPFFAHVPGTLQMRAGLWTEVSTLTAGVSNRAASDFSTRPTSPPSAAGKSILYRR